MSAIIEPYCAIDFVQTGLKQRLKSKHSL